MRGGKIRLLVIAVGVMLTDKGQEFESRFDEESGHTDHLRERLRDLQRRTRQDTQSDGRA